MNKVCIIGGSGTGKTTLAKNLGKELNLPVCHIDGIHHLENWQIRDKNERDKIILNKVLEDKWIIDGTYHNTLLQRIQSADLVIYLDYSSLAQVKGIMTRFLKNHGKEKEEIPGCNEQMSWKFFWWVVNWRKNRRNDIIEKINQIDKSKILIFKNRKQLNKWYKSNFNKQIEI